MTARQALLFAAPSDVCARCDGRLVITRDAIGRERQRCPSCDGVSRTLARHHVDDAFVPQTLVRADRLPVVQPGQLRCQRCATGVDGRRRFCSTCARCRKGQGGRPPRHPLYLSKPCQRCAVPFAPARPNARYCKACK